jgi:hypothetical protein
MGVLRLGLGSQLFQLYDSLFFSGNIFVLWTGRSKTVSRIFFGLIVQKYECAAKSILVLSYCNDWHNKSIFQYILHLIGWF